ncbi:enoyl-CoA hydratase-related protein [Aeromicrobium sp. Leaf350]|uniref:enoyl-CoA hydratase-related protein n=1 Tax=Aeromicrobium sp. Leaf350 TaxID=2876565 RepID=UPI001E5C03A9|nr:enoyl-CoA hydratase-related protein [Aeromicrobium sp. Leaf350]
MAEVLITERVDDVLVLTMNRPDRRNAVDRVLADALDAAFAAAEADLGVRVVVLTGGTEFFSAGTDLSQESSPSTPDGGPYGFVRRSRTVPLVAAVEGFALGGGLEMVLACDLVVAAEGTRLGLPEVKRGVVAVCGALFRAPDRLPPAVATEMLLTGEPILAERAHALGLVNRLAPPGHALAVALELAGEIAANSPAAVRTTVGAIIDARTAAEDDLWPLTERAVDEVSVSKDRVEGVAAFFEKRAPQWPTGTRG